jgi:thioredoxin reductase
MARPLIADPDLPNELKAGKRDQVAPCNHCLTCFQAVLAVGTPLYCRVNPPVTRAYTDDMPEGWEVQKAVTSKKVMVIGGGPAGMEAARIAAQRGHSVTLYESGSALGGKMRWAAAVKGTHEKIADHISYLTRQQEVNGVTVVKGTTVTAAMVKSNAPGAVVVAVGGTRPTLDIPGIGSSIVSSTTSTPTGTRVAVLGFNFQAVDYAIRLVKLGKEVTLVSSDPSELEANLDIEHPCWPRYFNKAWLRAKGVQIYGGATVAKITTSGLTLTTSYGTTADLELDAVVPFPSLVENSALFEAIKGMGIEVYAVGDCADPGTIAEATASANVTARKI